MGVAGKLARVPAARASGRSTTAQDAQQLLEDGARRCREEWEELESWEMHGHRQSSRLQGKGRAKAGQEQSNSRTAGMHPTLKDWKVNRERPARMAHFPGGG